MTRSDVWRLMRTPEPVHGDTRIVDVLPFLAIIGAGVVIRLLICNTDWVLISFPIGLVATVWARIHIPDDPQSGRDA